MRTSLIAGMVGFAILGFALGANPFGQASIVLAALVGLGALVVRLYELKPQKKDAYDLALLKQIHERKEMAKIDDELGEFETTGKAICLNCGDEYDPRLGRCPRCRRI